MDQASKEYSDYLRALMQEKIEVTFPNLPFVAHPVPALTYGGNLTPESAEELVASWLIYWGHPDVRLTNRGADGGVDVLTLGWAAQVKLYSVQKASVMEVRELFGVATNMGLRPMFFCSSGYTKEAISFAESAQIALFSFESETGLMQMMNLACDPVVLPKEVGIDSGAAITSYRLALRKLRHWYVEVVETNSSLSRDKDHWYRERRHLHSTWYQDFKTGGEVVSYFESETRTASELRMLWVRLKPLHESLSNDANRILQDYN